MRVLVIGATGLVGGADAHDGHHALAGRWAA